ncbi:MAG: Gfo/Idh/MocA family oxidoreductase [Bacteroidetes bacterium]|nr:Gfo/Idh/MocA family oxidoreductase [Bacteroidota bacterium]
MVTLGLIGCGYWGPNLVRNFRGVPGARLKTVSDLREGRLASILDSYPDLHTTTQFTEVLDDPEIDAVAIATPVDTHVALVSEALRRGKHVFVEKPLAQSAADAWNLVELSRSADRILAVGHVFQFAPGVRRLKRDLQAGVLGTVYHISSTRINPGPPDPALDVIWDLAPHDCSIILHLLDETPLSVMARGDSYKRRGMIDNAHVELAFPSGATAHIHVSWLSANKMRLMQVFGERGSVVYDEMLALDGKVKRFDNGIDNRTNVSDTDTVKLGYSAGDIHVLQLEQHEPLRMECEDFVRAVRSNTPGANSGEMGARVVELLETISRVAVWENQNA